MTIGVTGIAGFIGSNLADRLVDEGHTVIGFDNLSTGKKEYINTKAKFLFTDIAVIQPDFTGVDYVFHCAALPRIQPSILDPFLCHEANVTGTLNVLWAAKNAGVKRVIYSASSSAYGDNASPFREDMVTHTKSPYAAQKLMGEIYCRLFSELYGLDTICLRYFNVYGPRQSTEGAYATVFGIWDEQLAKGHKATIVGTGHQKRDFTHVSDVVRANIMAMGYEGKLAGQVINIGTGANVSILGAIKLLGYEYEFIESRLGETQETLADNKKAKEILGWQPTKSVYEYLDSKRK